MEKLTPEKIEAIKVSLKEQGESPEAIAGIIKNKLRRQLLFQLYEEQDGVCAYCGKETWLPPKNEKGHYQCNGMGPNREPKYRRATLEHLKKQEHGGSDDHVNCVMACEKCNCERGNPDAMEYMMLFRKYKDYHQHADAERNLKREKQAKKKKIKVIFLLYWALVFFPEEIETLASEMGI